VIETGKRTVIVMKVIQILAAFLFLSSAVAAQEIPDDLLEVDKRRIMKDCVPEFGEEVCSALSDCTIGEFRKRLKMDAYLNLTMQLSRREVDAANRTLLDDIAKFCTAHLEKSGVLLPAESDKTSPGNVT